MAIDGKTLLVGGDSEIAAATATFLRNRGHAVLATTRRSERVSADRPFLDLSQPLDGWQPPAGTRAACLCAAVARLGDCANDPDGSARVNVTGILAVADRLLARGIPLVFLSTDKVFEGTRAMMPADSPLCPVSEYGRQKAVAETALGERMRAGDPAAVLRLSKIVSPGMPLIAGWARDLAESKPIRAFYDMMMAPVPVAAVAAAIECLLAAPTHGIFQLSGPRDIAYSEVAARLAAMIGADPALIEPLSADTVLPPIGIRAQHTTLDSSALRDRFGLSVSDPSKLLDDLIRTCLPA